MKVKVNDPVAEAVADAVNVFPTFGVSESDATVDPIWLVDSSLLLAALDDSDMVCPYSWRTLLVKP